MTDTFIINAGSDLAVQFAWPDGNGGGADLTGYTIEAIDVHPSLASALSVSIADPASGLIALAVTWSDQIPRGRVAHFRLRLTSGQRVTTNLLWLQVE